MVATFPNLGYVRRDGVHFDFGTIVHLGLEGGNQTFYWYCSIWPARVLSIALLLDAALLWSTRVIFSAFRQEAWRHSGLANKRLIEEAAWEKMSPSMIFQGKWQTAFLRTPRFLHQALQNVQEAIGRESNLQATLFGLVRLLASPFLARFHSSHRLLTSSSMPRVFVEPFNLNFKWWLAEVKQLFLYGAAGDRASLFCYSVYTSCKLHRHTFSYGLHHGSAAEWFLPRGYQVCDSRLWNRLRSPKYR